MNETPRKTRGSVFARALPIGLLAGVLGFALACQTIGPTLSKRASANAGPYPEDSREIVSEWIETDFFDIATVRSLEVSTPVPGFSKGLFDSEPRFGWYVRVVFRGTDGLGTSTGKLFYSVLLREGQVVASRKHSY